MKIVNIKLTRGVNYWKWRFLGLKYYFKRLRKNLFSDIKKFSLEIKSPEIWKIGTDFISSRQKIQYFSSNKAVIRKVVRHFSLIAVENLKLKTFAELFINRNYKSQILKIRYLIKNNKTGFRLIFYAKIHCKYWSNLIL